MTTSTLTILALVREARSLVGCPPDDPRRAEFEVRKAALLAEVDE